MTSTKITRYLEYLTPLWVVIILLCVGQVVWWSMDNKPPFQIIRYQASSARAGESIELTAFVRRDIKRKCKASYSRHMFDSRGFRTDISSGGEMSAEAIEQTEKITPGLWRLAFIVPKSASPGMAHLFTSLSYVCNPMHDLTNPIPLTFEIDFEVLPP